MSDDTRWRTVRADADGVRVQRPLGVRGRVWSLAAAIVALTLALVFGLRRWREDPVAVASARPPAAARPPLPSRDASDAQWRQTAEGGEAVPNRTKVSIRRRAAGEAPAAARAGAPSAAAGRQPGAAAPAPDVPAPTGDAAAGAPEPALTGIQLFPPPGTSPPKSGIVVPEEFALPEGYVRHYQATDDGKMLAAILMFHPDYEFLDAAGKPIAVPEDRVVPPELAPPGLAIEMLEVPEVHLDGGLDF